MLRSNRRLLRVSAPTLLLAFVLARLVATYVRCSMGRVRLIFALRDMVSFFEARTSWHFLRVFRAPSLVIVYTGERCSAAAALVAPDALIGVGQRQRVALIYARICSPANASSTALVLARQEFHRRR